MTDRDVSAAAGRYRPGVRRALVAVLVTAALAGCAGASPDDAGPAATPTAATAAGVVDALGFTAPLIDGSELDLRSLAGRPVVFWFWSPY